MGIPAYMWLKDDGAQISSHYRTVAMRPRGVVSLTYCRFTWHYKDGISSSLTIG